MKEDYIKELVVLYHKNKFGDIAQTYSKDVEEKFYKLICSKLSQKYPQLVDYEKAVNLLKSRGNIFTANCKNNEGTYDSKGKNICVNHYLNRLTTTIFHETVHKYGDLRNEEQEKGVRELRHFFREPGTEKVTAESLMSGYTKGYVFGNVWGRFPNTIHSYYLSYLLASQMNYIIGGNLLEESVLDGKSTFEEKGEELYGKETLDSIYDVISRIEYKFTDYSYYNKIIRKKEAEKISEDLKKLINDAQELILKEGYKKKIEEVSSLEEANNLLNELLGFAEYRIRYKVKDRFEDSRFEKFFEDTKAKFKEKFPDASFEQKFDSNDWEGKYPDLKDVVEITDEERQQIKEQAKVIKRKYNPGFWDLIRGNKLDQEVSLLPNKKTMSQYKNDGFNFELSVNAKSSDSSIERKSKIKKKSTDIEK